MNSVGGRKFIVVVLSVVLVSILVWFAKISDSTFGTVIVSVVLGYMGGNVAQKWVNKGETNAVSTNDVTEVVEDNPA